MKKLIFSIAIGLMCLSTFGQEGFKFELKIEPNTTYITQMETTTDGIMDFEVEDEAILEQMKASGVETPMKMQQESSITLVSKTGDKNEDGSISAHMRYEKMSSQTTVNGEAMKMPNPTAGMQIIGKYNNEKIFEIDSIIGENVTEQMRLILTQTMETVQKQIIFPEKPLKIGDTFDNEIPMSIPMQGMKPMNIIINSTYLLAEVSEEKAYFDVDQTITLDTEQAQMKMSASGSGKGICEYSTADNYLVSYTSELPIKMTMEMNAMIRIKMQMDTKTALTVTIE